MFSWAFLGFPKFFLNRSFFQVSQFLFQFWSTMPKKPCRQIWKTQITGHIKNVANWGYCFSNLLFAFRLFQFLSVLVLLVFSWIFGNPSNSCVVAIICYECVMFFLCFAVFGKLYYAFAIFCYVLHCSCYVCYGFCMFLLYFDMFLLCFCYVLLCFAMCFYAFAMFFRVILCLCYDLLFKILNLYY